MLSEVRYPEFKQMEGCTVKPSRMHGVTEIVPACLGGVGMIGCVHQSECRQVTNARTEDEVRSILVEMRAVQEVQSV